MPYIYSLAAMAHSSSYILMRALAFDFPDDPEALKRTDEYMFGSAFLIAPVVSPMYYEAGSRPLFGVPETREVYLPKGSIWYDFWTNEAYEGGQTVQIPSPLERFPVLVRAGSIVPMRECPEKMYHNRDCIEVVRIYGGADGSFQYYYDDGDGWEFEQGACCSARMSYTEADHSLCMEHTSGKLPLPKIRRMEMIQFTKAECQ